MAYIEKLDGRRGRRLDSKTETGKADNTLNFALTAGAVGLGIALLDLEQAAAAPAAKPASSHGDDRLSDSSLVAEHDQPAIDRAAPAGHALHDNADNGPATPNEGEINVHAAAAASPEASSAALQDVPETAAATAAAHHVNAGDSGLEVATAAASMGPGVSAAAAHTNSGESGTTEGVHGISSLVDSAIAATAPIDHALDAAGDVLGVVGDVAHGLLGNGGVLGVAPVIAETVDGLVGKDGVLGSLVGEHNGDLLGNLAGNGNGILDGLVGQDAPLGHLVGGDGGGGILAAVTGSHGGILGGLLGGGGAAAASNGGAASSPDAGSSHDVAAAATQTDAAAGVPTNMFEVAHAALQITEGVADAITPTLTFVGQPIVEDDAHTDTDHSHLSIHHVA
jgi:hypothetical protein